jgi:hypothetical protein
MWGPRLPYKRIKNSRANSWKRSHRILIIVPSAQVHIVNGGHFSLDAAADEVAARVCEFMDMPKESIPEKKSWEQQRRLPTFPAVHSRECDAKGTPRRGQLEHPRPGEGSSGIRDRFTMEESLGVHQRTKRNRRFSLSQVGQGVGYRLIKKLWAFTGTASRCASLTSGTTIRVTGIAPGDGRGNPRGRWFSRWPLVAAEHFNLVPGR